MNGRFGWVPFLDNLTSSTKFHSNEQSDNSSNEFDFDNIYSKACGIDFEVEYYFSNATL